MKIGLQRVENVLQGEMSCLQNIFKSCDLLFRPPCLGVPNWEERDRGAVGEDNRHVATELARGHWAATHIHLDVLATEDRDSLIGVVEGLLACDDRQGAAALDCLREPNG